jgi:hypothetical protein
MPTTYMHATIEVLFSVDLCRDVISGIRNIGQGEARHRKYKRLKLGSGQAYDHSSD